MSCSQLFSRADWASPRITRGDVRARHCGPSVSHRRSLARRSRTLRDLRVLGGDACHRGYGRYPLRHRCQLRRGLGTSVARSLSDCIRQARRQRHGPGGYGATEVGFKYRFLTEDEHSWWPQAAISIRLSIFRLAMPPSTSVPGERTRFCRCGYEEHRRLDEFCGRGLLDQSRPGNRDYWYLGWAVQRQIAKNLSQCDRRQRSDRV